MEFICLSYEILANLDNPSDIDLSLPVVVEFNQQTVQMLNPG